MRVIVVGGVAAGASAATRIRRLTEDAEILMFERGEYVSFSNCALPYYLGGVIESSDDLVMMTPEGFKKRFNIDVYTKTEVMEINRAEKYVLVRDLKSGQERKEAYDKLVLATGARAILPKSIKGIGRPNVFTVKNVNDVVAISSYLEAYGVKKLAVAGGGFIGIETAENLAHAGYELSVIEGADQILGSYDEDMVQILHKELMDHGVKLYLSSMLTEIGDGFVRVKKGDEEQEIPAEAVIMAIGVAPETTLAVNAGLEIGETGGVKTDQAFRTSDPDIYAVGDAAESFDAMNKKPGRLALAGPAQRQARIAADHIMGIHDHNRGFFGSSCIRVFTQNAACTGMNEKAAKKAGIPYDVAYVIPSDKVGLMPDSNYMAFKLLFELPTGRILGAQAIGKGDVNRRVDVIAAMITMGADLEDLKELELCYSPVFGTAKDVVNIAALVGLNILYGRVRQVPVAQVRELVESGAYIIDVREKKEFEAGHLKNAVNIPLSEFRGRMDEVPKDVPVYLHCRTSQRSYYAICELQSRGWTNAVNIKGSFLGICLYEYFRDKQEGREPIVTAYNFK